MSFVDPSLAGKGGVASGMPGMHYAAGLGTPLNGHQVRRGMAWGCMGLHGVVPCIRSHWAAWAAALRGVAWGRCPAWGRMGLPPCMRVAWSYCSARGCTGCMRWRMTAHIVVSRTACQAVVVVLYCIFLAPDVP